MIVYASVSGRSRELAARVARKLEKAGRATQVLDAAGDADPWELLLSGECQDCAALISTAQGGLAPEPCRRTTQALEELSNDFRVGAAALRGQRFAVVGCGSSEYGADFCKAARVVEKQLRKLGAARVASEFLDDSSRDSGEAQFEAWTQRTVAALVRRPRREKRESKPKEVIKEDEEPSGVADVEDLVVATKDGQEMVTTRQAAALKKEGYKLIGSHSAVKMCRWTKHQLRGRGGCYKHTFYGITSYQCMEATPSLACANKCIFCIAEGTLVNLADGVSVPIEDLARLDRRPVAKVLALDDSESRLVPAGVTAFTDSGTKPCVEVFLSDGRTLICTEDHRIRTLDGSWVEAGRLKQGVKVAVGVEFPKSSLAVDPADSNWSLDLRSTLGCELHLRDEPARSKTLVFARLVGYLLTDGAVSSSTGQATIFLGHQLDLDTVQADLSILTDDAPTLSKDNNTFRVALPESVSTALAAVGCAAGARVDAVSHIPQFLIGTGTPLIVQREFVGALFGGGGGVTPSVSHDKSKKLRFACVGFVTARKGRRVVAQRQSIEDELIPMLQRVGMSKPTCVVSNLVDQLKKRKKAGDKIGESVPDAKLVDDASYNITWSFPAEDITRFAAEFGFRYCCHKQMRLSAAVSYFRGKEYISRQRKWLCHRTQALMMHQKTLKASLEQAKRELGVREQLHAVIEKWKPKEANHLTEGGVRSWSVNMGVEDYGLKAFFSSTPKKARYNAGERALQEEAEATGDDQEEDDEPEDEFVDDGEAPPSWPLFGVVVVAVRKVGAKRVYDLTVPRSAAPQDGSFMANGVVVHNCWRHHKNPVGKEWRWKTDDPKEIVAEAVRMHVGMIKEAKGVPGVLEDRWREAHTVRHCALSLVGEPIMYPRINEMLDELHSRRISTFLVTNAQFPEAIEQLRPVTQLYVSVDAANEQSLKEVDRPLFDDAWRRLRASLVALRRKKQRTVARLTIVKGHNAADLKGYAELIALGEVSFVEIKGVTFCGKSDASSLTMDSCPWHHEIVEFAHELLAALKVATNLEYGVACAHKHSVSVLLARVDQFAQEAPDGTRRWNTWIDYDKFHDLVSADSQDFAIGDYLAPTPDWALAGASEDGFDPSDTRLYKKKANGKSR